MKPKHIICLFVAFISILMLCQGISYGADKHPIKVGVYNFKPLVFIDAAGNTQGFFIDILNHIAEKENWEITYIPGSWSECLSRLENGEIDLQPSIAYSEERAIKFDFTDDYLFLDWGIVYRQKGSSIHNIFDLQGKIVSVLNQAQAAADFKKLSEQFGITCQFVEKDEYTQVIESVDRKEVDAGICLNVYGILLERNYNVQRTPIIFSPTKMRFAVKKGVNPGILSVLNRYFSELKADKSSIYYHLLDRWINNYRVKEILPKWLLLALLILIISCFLSFVFNLILKRQVRRKISDLMTANQKLGDEMIERKRMEETLRQSEQRLSFALEMSNIGAWELNLNDRTANRTLIHDQIFGYESLLPDWTYEMFMEHVLPEDRIDVDSRFRDAIAIQKIWNFECRIRRTDGQIRWIWATGGHERDAEGKSVRLSGIVHDITERKRMEEKLRKSEERYRILVETANEGIWAMDSKHLTTYVNHAMADMLGYSPSEMIGKNVEEFFFPEDMAFHSERMEKRHEGEDEVYERRFIRRNGSPLWTLVSAKSLKDEHGNFIGSFALFTDITERKRAENALAEEAIRRRILFEQSRDGIVVLDHKGRVYEANQRYAEMLGYTMEEVNQLHVWDWDTQWTQEQLLEMIRAVNTAGEHFETCHRRKDGSVYHVEISSNGALWNGQKLVFCVCRDITERRQAEEERRNLEAQLRQAQKMEAVGQLAGGVAHDFNNLLYVITGYADMMLEELPPDGHLHSNMKEIMKAAQRATTLVRQLLLFSRREAMQMKLLNLNDLISELIKMLRRVIGEHITLEFLPGFELMSNYGDPGQLEQILMNLCVNARDAMPGGGRIVIETQNISLDAEYCRYHSWANKGDYVLLKVSDTGSGIPAEIQEHIFEPFFTTKEVGKGTGLGLAAVYGIVRSHQGMIRVYSEPGYGTAFKVYLPAVQNADVLSNSEEFSAPLSGGNETLLIAEDEESVRNMIVHILKKVGYRILSAKDGEEALSLFEKHSAEIDLAMLDVVMPKVGGQKVYEQIRAICPDMPIIFSTGYSRGVLCSDSFPANDYAMIQKPCNPTALLRKVREVLDKRTAEQ